MTQEDLLLWQNNNSQASVIQLYQGRTRAVEGEYKIPTRDNWVIVFENIIQSSTWKDFDIITKVNFFNFALNVSLIVVIVVSMILSFLIPFTIEEVSISKQIKLQEEKQHEYETREITFTTKETQERTELLKSIMLHYDRLPIDVLVGMLRLHSVRELKVWHKTLPDDLQFHFDQNEVLFLKELKIVIEEELPSLPLINNLSKDDKYFCSKCGEIVISSQKKCLNCNEQLRCAVCKLPIYISEKKCKCPHCDIVGHLLHFHVWIVAVNKCPHCLVKLTPTELVLLQ